MHIKYLGLIIPFITITTAQATSEREEYFQNDDIYLNELKSFEFYDLDDQNIEKDSSDQYFKNRDGSEKNALINLPSFSYSQIYSISNIDKFNKDDSFVDGGIIGLGMNKKDDPDDPIDCNIRHGAKFPNRTSMPYFIFNDIDRSFNFNYDDTNSTSSTSTSFNTLTPYSFINNGIINPNSNKLNSNLRYDNFHNDITAPRHVNSTPTSCSISDIMENRYKSLSNQLFEGAKKSYDNLKLSEQVNCKMNTFTNIFSPEYCNKSIIYCAKRLCEQHIIYLLKQKNASVLSPLAHEVSSLRTTKSYVDTKRAMITDKHALFETLRIFNKSYYLNTLVLNDDSYTILKLLRSMNIKSRYIISTGKLFYIFDKFRFGHLKLHNTLFMYVVVLNEIDKLGIKISKMTPYHQLIAKHIKKFNDFQNKMNKNNQSDIRFAELPNDDSIAKLFDDAPDTQIPEQSSYCTIS